MRRFAYLFLIFTLGFGSYAWSQTQKVTGTITDAETGDPLPGVNILVEETSNGTISDIDGNYTLNIEKENAVLKFSYIGYQTVRRTVDGNSTINVGLQTDLEQLDEVIVTGYGTQKKYDLTGSISSVKGDDLTKLPMPSFDQALQGQAAGVQVSSSAGVPGGATRIMVRGTNSISAGTEPLIILDGMPIFSSVTGVDGTVQGQPQNPLAAINPADIESIEVLKDAAATAIYGSRGANGVILISTKTGEKGKGSTSASFTTGITQPRNLLEFATTDEWFQLADQARASNLSINSFTDDFVLVGEGGIYTGPRAIDYDLTVGRARDIQTDWMDFALQQGNFNEFNLSTNRGFDKGFYFISGNYRDENAIYEGGRLRRYSLRSNLEFEPITNFQFGARISGTFMNNDRPLIRTGFQNANGSALPFFPVYTDEGDYFWPFGNNLVAGLDPDLRVQEAQNYRSIGIFHAQWVIPWIEGLKVRSELGYDIFHSINSSWVSEILSVEGTTAEQSGRTASTTNWNVYGTYNRTFGEHFLNVVAGVETTQRNSRSLAVNGQGDALRTDIQEPGTLADNNFRSAFAGITDDELFRGYFGRFTYKWRDRYLINGSFRRDGSSRFLEGRRWAVFPALSAGWIISDEDFFSGLGFINMLKLRASYGVTGNKNVPARIGEIGFIEWGFYGAGTQGLVLSNLPAEAIFWETTTTYEAGVDYGFFNNRLSGSVGYFYMDINDLLLNAPVPPSFGASPYGSPTIWGNIGDMDNQGFEFEVTSINIDNKDFRWSTNFNFSTNANEIISLTQLQEGTRGGIIVGDGFVANESGGALATFFLPEYAGLDENGDELIYEVDQETGERTGETLNITNADVLRDNRRILEGKTGLPTYWGGMQNTLSYLGFDLSILFSWQGGNYLLDRHREGNSYLGTGGQVLREVVTDSWRPNATDNPLPRQRWANLAGRTTTTRFLYPGDFLRLRNVQLRYNLPKELLSRIGMKSMSVFASGQNLLTFTKYPGADPEVLNLASSAESRNLTQGIVGGGQALPRVRTFTMGLNLSF